jgi:transposase
MLTAEATESQELENWIGSHIRAFEISQGVPKLVIPNNTRTGVNRACRVGQLQAKVNAKCKGIVGRIQWQTRPNHQQSSQRRPLPSECRSRVCTHYWKQPGVEALKLIFKKDAEFKARAALGEPG